MDISSSKYSRVCPYLMISSIERQLAFLTATFDCEVIEEIKNQAGQLQHAEIRLGNVVIMMGRERKEWPSRKGMNYVFVNNTAEVFRKAVSNGATEIMKPEKRDYGLVEAGVEDFFGNQWWIGQTV